MAHIITLANAKGGCGKSTVAFNLAICFAREGYKTLAIDIDQQGNLSDALGVDLDSVTKTAHRLMIDEDADVSDFLIECRPRLHLIPNTIEIESDDLLEAKKVNRELLLRKKLKPIQREFDVIVIDTPPAMRSATLNALTVASTVIIPVDSGRFALLGLGQLRRILSSIHEAHNPNMVLRALTTMYNRKQKLDQHTREQVIKFFGENLVMDAIIHKNVAIPEAAAAHKGIVEYDKEATGSFDFVKATKELIAREMENGEEERSERARRKS